ncbi:MAG: nitrilase-related carbon-nitrogen hydrolase [bacterium]|nr:nitrilase-related carbon-nitrogen hydrolase [bacterium]
MKIALLQGDITWNSALDNLARYEKLLDVALKESPTLILLPEMFTTGFSFPQGDFAQKACKVGSHHLENAAKDHKIYIAGSLPLIVPPETRPFNALRIYGPDGHLADYSKLHLFSLDGEEQHYRKGERTITLPILDFRVSFSICYDLRFPQLYSSIAPQTDLFVVCANWPEVRQQHWETLLRARAIENQAFVAGVNRVGKGGNGLTYAGGSMIISPRGEILAQADNTEQILQADLNLEEVKKWRDTLSCLKDRREDVY